MIDCRRTRSVGSRVIRRDRPSVSLYVERDLSRLVLYSLAYDLNVFCSTNSESAGAYQFLLVWLRDNITALASQQSSIRDEPNYNFQQ